MMKIDEEAASKAQSQKALRELESQLTEVSGKSNNIQWTNNVLLGSELNLNTVIHTWSKI